MCLGARPHSMCEAKVHSPALPPPKIGKKNVYWKFSLRINWLERTVYATNTGEIFTKVRKQWPTEARHTSGHAAAVLQSWKGLFWCELLSFHAWTQAALCVPLLTPQPETANPLTRTGKPTSFLLEFKKTRESCPPTWVCCMLTLLISLSYILFTGGSRLRGHTSFLLYCCGPHPRLLASVVECDIILSSMGYSNWLHSN